MLFLCCPPSATHEHDTLDTFGLPTNGSGGGDHGTVVKSESLGSKIVAGCSGLPRKCLSESSSVQYDDAQASEKVHLNTLPTRMHTPGGISGRTKNQDKVQDQVQEICLIKILEFDLGPYGPILVHVKTG